ncbi:MAG TPA: metallophosphatase [Bacteroidia bacterium]|nr:metallophosphatase [Bacteroidia bacterium]
MAEYSTQNRREFLRYMLGAAAIYGSASNLLANEILLDKGITKLTILYTNDVHSRIEPFPDNDPKYANQGGAAKRAAIINKIRKEEKNVLLLDAGDIFQGTPYFNFYAGELEFKLMSQMGYDVSTFGNHDFDFGVDNIVKQMPHASFEFLNANYDFKDSPLAGRINPYKIIKKDGLKIGVFGLGIELQGLVEKKNYGNIQYNDPIEAAKKTASILKHEKKCDYVICLSHLGYNYAEKKVSDTILSEQTQDIDLIIGGHTHTFLEEPKLKTNTANKMVYVTQVGWAGIWMGRIDVMFSKNTVQKTATASVVKVHEHIG